MFALTSLLLMAGTTPDVSSFCKPGAAVEGLAAGSWHPAIAIGPNADGGCAIRMSYSGYEDRWDMSPEKVRPAGATTGERAARGNGTAARSAGLCVPGTAVEVRLTQRWYPAVVSEGMRADGTCRIQHRAYAGMLNDHDVALSELRPPQGATSSGTPDATPSKGLIVTTPQRIYDTFKRAPEMAEQRMIGAPVRVSGRADVVDDKNIIFKLNNYQLVVQCLFEPGDRAALRSVREGANVTVEGVATNTLGPTSVRLQQCKLVSQQAPVKTANAPTRPPLGNYYCMNAGSSVGALKLTAGGYTIAGVSGSYRYNAGSRSFSWQGGSFAKWGWSGSWRTDSVFTNGPAEPRIELTDGGSLHVHCFPKG